MLFRLLFVLLAAGLFGAAPAGAQETWDESMLLGDSDAWYGPASPQAPVFAAPPAAASPAAVVMPGDVAGVRPDGRAVPPRRAPAHVKAMIAAANRIVGKPYKWGGGHARLEDRGYDCSGAVGYALIRAGLQRSPMVSGQYARWGLRGTGRWVTIYANRGHVYMEVAGLRLDTSPIADASGAKGPRWRGVIGPRAGFKVRHIPGL